MKTNDIQKKTVITRDALRYYEKEGLIHPIKEDNGYRNYSEKDLETIMLIQEYRKMDISIADIKNILAGELSIYDCLKNKEKYIQAKMKELDQQLQLIQNMTSRKKLDFIYQSQNTNEACLLFLDDCIKIVPHNETIPYNQILRIKLRLCSRLYNQISDNFITYGFIGLFGIRGIGLSNKYSINIDIITKHNTYQFESTTILKSSFSQFIDIFHLLQNQDIPIDDAINLISIFDTKKNYYEFSKYIDYHIKQWEKDHLIDSPEGYEIDELIHKTQEKTKP